MSREITPSTDTVGITGRGDGGDPSLVLSAEHYPVVRVEVNRLLLSGSPRMNGEDTEHIRILADVQDELPPITVRRATMQVIDGRHRVRAALLNGNSTISARLIDCDERTAFILAVRENITHGLPLQIAERKAAALSIIASRPDWSDRSVGAAAGLSDKTVSALRAGATADSPQSDTRVGKDGRVRPVNSAVSRRQAAAMMSERPDAGIREVARVCGLSPATVRDVRQRLERGEDPVPERYRKRSRDFTAAPRKPRAQAPSVDSKALLAKVMNDPTVRMSETGRNLVRWLHRHAIDAATCSAAAASVPDHWMLPVAGLARSCAAAWIELAEQLERKAVPETSRSALARTSDLAR
jgi:ParB-like chromosome segregation protein Spo0J